MSRKANFDVTGAWLEGDDPGDRKFIKIGDLLLENGETLPDITIAYQSWGTLNADKSNAILVNHAMTGWSDVPGWWPQMVGPGLPFDTDKYFVLCPNVIGGCQGSTGPASIAPDGKRYGSRFPIVTIRDMVSAEIAFSDALGIDKYLLAVGPSLGGMRSLEWAVQLPERVSAICTIGSSAVATGDQIGTFSVQIQAIKSDPYFNGGDYYEQERGPVDGMGIARRIAHLTYRTESEMDVRFGRQLQGDETGRYAVQSYLDHQANKLAKRFDANTYIALTDAMNSHDIGRERGGVVKALASVKVPVVVVSIDTDRLFVPRLQVEISELVPTAEPPIVISSEFGHDGFLVESEAMGAAIRHALHVAGTI
ncbi:homoserine O-acetyltransferase MetX [Candidatus Planktophila versatilis]|jgi:homoserine O-acetyltransferase|uniref:Homoserine O-acetyltransferase n=1 Tax=Candidatus Planktophila versatilis TaxID=1884905 RepID=A0ABN5BFH5_9ACTN|nr:homoserine O-acetyltransferase [Candidatus Planktophila versatilis]ASY17080.1 homoserine O-acetyltransferase [Candidatus Planktophila versatilis]